MINHVLEKGLWAMGFSAERKKEEKVNSHFAPAGLWVIIHKFHHHGPPRVLSLNRFNYFKCYTFTRLCEQWFLFVGGKFTLGIFT
jgi:hypothetical protein